MDEHLAQLNRHVAAAADAWLTDPRDAGVYARLVTAIEARRRYLHPQLEGEARDVDESGPPVGDVDQEEVLDDLGLDGHGEPVPVGQDLAGDPMAALSRLRAGRPQPAGE